MKITHSARLLCSCLAAIVLTGCIGPSDEELSQRRFDAISTVTRMVYEIIDLEVPETLAATTPCFGPFGNEIDQTGARWSGMDIKQSVEKSLIDDLLAGFGEPKRADREGQLNTGLNARLVDFKLTIDDQEVFFSAYVSNAGQFGWSASAPC